MKRLTSHVFGTKSQKSSILMSPKSVCNVTDYKENGRKKMCQDLPFVIQIKVWLPEIIIN